MPHRNVPLFRKESMQRLARTVLWPAGCSCDLISSRAHLSAITRPPSINWSRGRRQQIARHRIVTTKRHSRSSIRGIDALPSQPKREMAPCVCRTGRTRRPRRHSTWRETIARPRADRAGLCSRMRVTRDVSTRTFAAFYLINRLLDCCSLCSRASTTKQRARAGERHPVAQSDVPK